MTEMNLAILSYHFLPILGGGEIFHNKLALHLSKEGNLVFVISSCPSLIGNLNRFPVYKTPCLFQAASRITHPLVAAFLLFFMRILKRVDIVHVAGVTDLLAAFPAKVIFRIPVVLRLSMWSHPYFLERLRRVVSFLADVIIVFDSNMKAKLVESGYYENKIVVIPNGVDTEKFRPNLATKKKDKVTFLWVARLEIGKAPQLAVETLALVKNFHKNVCLKLVGEGEMENQLRELANRYKVTDSVIFLGRQNHNKMPEIMMNTDIFLMTSKGEGMSNALLEAMASGLAIVATSASASGVLENGFNGYIANNPEKMASTLSKLINDSSLRRVVGNNARQTVIEKYSNNQMFTDYLQVYKKLVRK
jgi:glycosyltransferase involved in cell wall biosynthesis